MKHTVRIILILLFTFTLAVSESACAFIPFPAISDTATEPSDTEQTKSKDVEITSEAHIIMGEESTGNGLDSNPDTVYVSPVGVTSDYLFGFDEPVYVTQIVINLGESYGTVLPFHTTSDNLSDEGVYTPMAGVACISNTSITLEINTQVKVISLGLVCAADEFITLKDIHIYTRPTAD